MTSERADKIGFKILDHIGTIDGATAYYIRTKSCCQYQRRVFELGADLRMRKITRRIFLIGIRYSLR